MWRVELCPGTKFSKIESTRDVWRYLAHFILDLDLKYGHVQVMANDQTITIYSPATDLFLARATNHYGGNYDHHHC